MKGCKTVIESRPLSDMVNKQQAMKMWDRNRVSLSLIAFHEGTCEHQVLKDRWSLFQIPSNSSEKYRGERIINKDNETKVTKYGNLCYLRIKLRR